MGDQASTPTQIISLPKGGGAQQGLGEKFSPDLHTGTGNFTVPIAVPSGRNGFEPQLNLAYSTGSGNGPFGFGWSLSVPGVGRKTSKGIPRYDDGKDVFVLSGSEDLVKVAGEYPGRVQYRPRSEGLFALIEHVRDSADDYWQVKSKDGLVSIYGTMQHRGDDPAVIAKPGLLDRDKVFAWRLALITDPFGNRIEYEYERDRAAVGPNDWDQLYLKQIRYVDYRTAAGVTKFLVTITLNYEDRSDQFSEYRPGFEIRTRRRCKSLLVETHANQTLPVREYQFAYENDAYNGVSFLQQIQLLGFDDQANRYDGKIHGGQLRERQLPPLEFHYTRFDPEKRKFALITGADLPPQSVGNPNMEFVDLHGAGLSDILEMNGTVRYWRNLGNLQFDIPRPMREAPAGMELAAAGVQLLDANGDGRTDLMVSGEPLAGYFPLEFPAKWNAKSFQRYSFAPSINLEDPEVRLIDLDGDGVTDVLRSGTRMECFFNNPKEGWNPDNIRWIERQALEVFPDVSFSDVRVKLADMTGDGMQDIVLVYDGNVEYWPNLGYGNWGKRIHMEHSPRFPLGYDPKRILIGDVDGDGMADLVYVDHDEVHLWINQSGNRWTEKPIVVRGTPPVTDIDGLRLVDLGGSGTSGVLWCTDVGRLGPRNFMFLDFTGGDKPYLLNEMNNHLGAVTRVHYQPSTHFYIEDEKQIATRWRTPLPFPVQVVAKVEVVDEISRGRLTTEYRYHHGYWDGTEREFRGFGMVEQIDSETFLSHFEFAGNPMPFDIVEEIHFSPPTLTKTWFHLGPVGPEFGDWNEDLDWSNEFWPGDAPVLDHKEFVTPFLRTLERNDPNVRRIRRDAIRTLRGNVLRTELYALDGSPDQDRPYTVTERQYGLSEVDPSGMNVGGHLRIFFPHLRGQRITQWERGYDPLTIFSLTENYNDFGLPQRNTSIACPRGWLTRTDRPNADYLATRVQTRYASPQANGPYIHSRVAATMTFELTNTATRTLDDLRWLPDSAASLVLIGQTLNYYDGAEFAGLAGLNFARIGQYGALARTEQLVFTDQHMRDAFADTGISIPPWLASQNPNWTTEYPDSFRLRVPSRGGYLYADGADGFHAAGYFATTAQKAYDVQRGTGTRGLVLARRDPLGHETSVDYDAFDFLPVQVTDPVDLAVSATYDYQSFQPKQITDSNGNTAVMEYNPLGLLARTWVKGKQANEGDFQRPSVELAYYFRTFEQRAEPISVRTLRYERHDTDPDDTGDTIETREYSDGFGRLLQTRTQAEDVLFGDSRYGAEVLANDITTTPGLIRGTQRNAGEPVNVVVTGWQVHDNKGRVVEKYEPFFDTGWEYVLPKDRQLGRKVMLFYDPRGQLIRVLNPDGSEQRVIYGVPNDISNPPQMARDTTQFLPTPWENYTYDANDNAGRSHAAPSQPYRHHWNTPRSAVVDALGRAVKTIQRNRNAPGSAIEEYQALTAYDIRGNITTITDIVGRKAFRHVFDLANRRLRLNSIDAGLRLTCFDAAGNLVETRDGKGAITLRAFDEANRPTDIWVRNGSIEPVVLQERREYGDQLPDQNDARQRNLKGKLNRHYDGAGKVMFELYDFKGNLLEKVRSVIAPTQLVDPAFRVDWGNGNAPQLSAADYRISTTYDALNRIHSLQFPLDVDGERKKMVPTYNRAGALESLTLGNETFLERVAYNAKGQRTLTAYGNNVFTVYDYDDDTFRLARMWTSAFTRPGDAAASYQSSGIALQNLGYSYDLVGNLRTISEFVPGCGVRNNVDAARYVNLAAALSAGDALVREFEYDALYRLKRATGREAGNIQALPPWPDGFHAEGFNWGTPAIPAPGNARDLTRRYVQLYDYDPVGNMMKLWHDAGGSQWARYSGMSGMTPEQWRNNIQAFAAGGAPNWGTEGNRLTNFGIDTEGVTHRFDANGNMAQEFANRMFEWDHSDRLRRFRELDGAGNTRKEGYYLYDATGQRVVKRATIETRVEVTIYIDGIFEHRIFGVNENNTIHLMDNLDRIVMLRAGQALQGDTGAKVQYQLSDHLGNSSITVGGDDFSAMTFNNREEFFPYGETSFGSFAKKRYRFSGKERDEESELHHFGARQYAPWLIRWINADPVTIHLNSFQYVGLNPVRFKDPDGKFDKDMHYGVALYLLRSAGVKESEAKEIAQYNQYVDESPQTEPLNTPFLSGRVPLATGLDETTARNRAFFHFPGSTQTTTVVAGDSLAQKRFANALDHWKNTSKDASKSPKLELENTKARMEVGTAGHTYLDTWSHEGFTAYWSALNMREGTARPNVGHADAPEGGHAPDRAYNNVDRALAASKAFYDLIPKSPGSVPWSDLEPELRKVFSTVEPDEEKRVKAVLDLYEKRFGTRPQYDSAQLKAYRPMFDGHIHGVWKDQVQKQEAVSNTKAKSP